MELEDRLNQMIQEEMSNALKRLQSIAGGNWIEVVNEVIAGVKKIPTITLLAVRLDHISGLEFISVCTEGTFAETVVAMAGLEIAIFDKFLKVWGNFRTHDERALPHIDLQDYYTVEIK